MSPASHLACRRQGAQAGQIDGFWANAMGAQNAITSGVGKVVLDVRRGIGPKAAFHYTMPVLVTSDRAIERDFRRWSQPACVRSSRRSWR